MIDCSIRNNSNEIGLKSQEKIKDVASTLNDTNTWKCCKNVYLVEKFGFVLQLKRKRLVELIAAI